MRKHKKKHQLVISIITSILAILFFSAVIFSQRQLPFITRNIKKDIAFFLYKIKAPFEKKEFQYEYAHGVPVLVYHGLIDTPDRFNTTPSIFLDQMLSLKKAGYETISPLEFIDFIESNKPVPKKSFLLTFDDGRKDSYYQADPILKLLGYKAVMFIATHQSLDKEDSDYYLTKQEVVSMAQSGRWFIESHAVQSEGGFIPIDPVGNTGYFLSNRKWLVNEGRLENHEEYTNRVIYEISSSKDQIKKSIGITPTLFSYPFTDYGQGSLNQFAPKKMILEQVSKSYSGAFRQIWPWDQEYLYNIIGEKKNLLKRFETPSDMSGKQLVELFDQGQIKELPFEDTFSRQVGWKSLWGEVVVEGVFNNLNLKRKEVADGAFTFLDGSNLWKNYAFSAQAVVPEDSMLSLLFRFKDTKNYTRCTFSKEYTSIEQFIDGKMFQLAKEKQLKPLSGNSLFRADIYNKSVACYIDDVRIISATTKSNSPTFGGIGMSLWKSTKDGISIKKVQVVSLEKPLSGSDVNKYTSSLEKKNLIVEQKGQPEKIRTVLFNNIFIVKSVWGGLELLDNFLSVFSGDKNTSSTVIIPRNNGDKSSSMVVKFESIQGEIFSLIAGYTDSKNYVSCSFHNNFYKSSVRLDKIVNGKVTQIARVPVFLRVKQIKDVPFQIATNGNNVTCGANGTIILNETIHDLPKEGSFGIGVWDKIKNNASVLIREIYFN